MQDGDPDAVGTPPQRRIHSGVDAQRSLRVRAAWMVFIEGWTQSEVGERLGLNRVAVTRLLSESKRLGEVEVRVRSDIQPLVELERALEERFALERAVVAPCTDPKAAPIRVIAAAAGGYISRWSARA